MKSIINNAQQYTCCYDSIKQSKGRRKMKIKSFSGKIIVLFVLIIMISIAINTSAFAYTSTEPLSGAPWYGNCTGNGVNIRASASINSTSLGLLYSGDPIEIIQDSTNGWYKVRYNTSGEYGYVSDGFLDATAYTYGKVYLLPSIALRSTKNTSGQLVCYVNYGEAMPYNTLSTVSGVQWAHCVRGRYPGWADTGFNASFQYED